MAASRSASRASMQASSQSLGALLRQLVREPGAEGYAIYGAICAYAPEACMAYAAAKAFGQNRLCDASGGSQALQRSASSTGGPGLLASSSASQGHGWLPHACHPGSLRREGKAVQRAGCKGMAEDLTRQQSTPRQRHTPRLLLVPVKDSEVAHNWPVRPGVRAAQRPLTAARPQACQAALRWVLHNLWAHGCAEKRMTAGRRASDPHVEFKRQAGS